MARVHVHAGAPGASPEMLRPVPAPSSSRPRARRRRGPRDTAHTPSGWSSSAAVATTRRSSLDLIACVAARMVGSRIGTSTVKAAATGRRQRPRGWLGVAEGERQERRHALPTGGRWSACRAWTSQVQRPQERDEAVDVSCASPGCSTRGSSNATVDHLLAALAPHGHIVSVRVDDGTEPAHARRRTPRRAKATAPAPHRHPRPAGRKGRYWSTVTPSDPRRHRQGGRRESEEEHLDGAAEKESQTVRRSVSRSRHTSGAPGPGAQVDGEIEPIREPPDEEAGDDELVWETTTRRWASSRSRSKTTEIGTRVLKATGMAACR